MGKTTGSLHEGLTITEEAVTDGALSPACVFRLIGDVDLVTHTLLNERVRKALEDKYFAAVVIDRTNVGFLDSAGLALLVELRKKTKRDGLSPICLVVPPRVPPREPDEDQPYRVLTLTRFDMIIPIGDSVHNALQAAATFTPFSPTF